MGNLTLSITTIGDLLLENRITRKKDGKPIDNVSLSIPEYQRPYKWTARNAIQLLDDILEARNANKEVYTDYKLWKKYADELRREKINKGSEARKDFFKELGCSDFELDAFNNFYFSRTRKSLEHYYPQAKAGADKPISTEDINRFGNFAMIGAEANSSGSNWDPKTKLDHYSDGKTDQVSVASLKFKIMMQMCQDNLNGDSDRPKGMEWNVEDMLEHQEKMLNIII